MKNINKTYHVNVNVNLIVGNVTRTKKGIVVNVDVSGRIQHYIMHAKKIIFGIILFAVVKIVDI